MLESDALRQILQQKAIDAVTQLGFPCRIDEESFVVPTDGTIYGEFQYTTGKTKQAELGAVTGFECTPGVLQFALYAPEKKGTGEIGRLGDRLKPLFNRKEWQVPPDGYVTLEAVSVQIIKGVHDGKKVVIVDAGFDFYHKNPDAT